MGARPVSDGPRHVVAEVILAFERIEAGSRRIMVARLATVIADLSSLHTGRSCNPPPFLTLVATLIHLVINPSLTENLHPTLLEGLLSAFVAFYFGERS